LELLAINPYLIENNFGTYLPHYFYCILTASSNETIRINLLSFFLIFFTVWQKFFMWINSDKFLAY